MELSVVIPAYNEEAIIAHVIDSWSNELKRLKIKHEIRVYNDGSKDGTLQKLKQITNPFLVIIDQINSGHGPTVWRGYKESQAEWVFQVDGDNELGPEDFEKFWIHRDQYNFLIGKRVRRTQGLLRRFVSYIARWLVRVFFRSKIYDVNCPYRLIRRKYLHQMLNYIPSQTLAPNVALSGIVARLGLSVFQIDISYRPRTTGEVSIANFRLLKFSIRSFFQLLIIVMRYPTG